MRRLLPTVLTLALALQACAGKPPTGATPGPRGSKAPTANGTNGSPRPGGTIVAGERPPAAGALRVVPQAGEPASLTGRVKLISNNGGAVISNNSGGLISNNGGGLLSDHGSGLVSKTKYDLLQAAESALADARIELVDATGRVLVDDRGRPLGGTTDAKGDYRFDAVLPAEGLVLRVKLNAEGHAGGELSALLPREASKARQVPIDTATTLGATYVLTQFVKGDQKTFDKLPMAEAERLRTELEAARGLITGMPSYKPDELVALTDKLRQQAPAVDKALSDIKALLLGQANLGGGRMALEVPLSDPRAMLRLKDGSLLVSEALVGRVRRIAPDGTITTWVDSFHGEVVKANWFGLLDLCLAPDGAVYMVDNRSYRVRRVAPDGAVTTVAGNGQPPGPLTGTATTSPIVPRSIALGTDGTLYVAEDKPGDASPPRVMAVAPTGAIRELARGPEAWTFARLVGLAVAEDGTLYVLSRRQEEFDGLWKLEPGATTWTLITTDLALENEAYMVLEPAGTLLVAEDGAGRISRLTLDGKKTVIAGKGGPPATAGIVTPSGLLLEPDGTLLFTDAGTNRVMALGKDGTLRALAGAANVGPGGDDGTVAVNAPGGIGFDAAGRLVLTEGGSHTIKRLDGKTLTTIAGGVKGSAGDGGAATSARFDTPTGIAIDGDQIWVIDMANHALRHIDATGKIRSAAGSLSAQMPLRPGVPVAPTEYGINRAVDLALGPDKLPVWNTIYFHQIHRLRPDGQVELVAGVGARDGADRGDGGPPTQAAFDTPLGLCYGPDGSLYISDAGNMRIRRITPDGAKIEAFAGKGRFETLAGIVPGEPGPAAIDRREALLVLPAEMCFDAAGNMYVAELGTICLPLLAGQSEGLSGLPIDDLPKIGARIRKIAPDGTTTTIAGLGGKFFADPLAGDALVMPTGLAIDPQGRLVIVDAGANLIRFLPAGSF